MLTRLKLRLYFLPLCFLPLCAAGLLGGGTRPAQSAPAPSGWQSYRNAALGFAVERPAGWTVKADSRSVLVQSQDRSETMLMEAFSAAPGVSAEAALDRLPEDRAALFPQAGVSEIAPQPSQGDEVTASLSYQAQHGPGQGRVLCSVIHGKGLLFVLAAPSERFDTERPMLTKIVKSLRFMVPARISAARLPALPKMSFVTWTDPREHAFHVSIPQGWKADGGAFRFGPTDVRTAYQVMSPDKGMSVLIGDPRLPSTFQAPNAFTQSVGMGDGSNGLLHFMSALEFNRWYLDTFGGLVLSDLTVGAEHPLTEISDRQTAALRQASAGMADVEASMGITEFSGRSKETGKQVTGIIIGATQRRTNNAGGMESTTWSGNPMVLACLDNAGKSRSQQIVLAVLTHLMQTYREDPAWIERRAREIEQATGQALQRTAQRSQQIAKDSDTKRSALMGYYWGHVSAESEQQRGFINYMGDRTDVTSADGVTHTVQGGSKHYYQNSRTGTISGTDSAYSPGVDFTPLTER